MFICKFFIRNCQATGCFKELESLLGNIPRTTSDYYSMIIYMEGMDFAKPSNRPFRCEAVWFCFLQNHAFILTALAMTIYKNECSILILRVRCSYAVGFFIRNYNCRSITGSYTIGFFIRNCYCKSLSIL